MTKVAYNRDFGGFSLSERAVRRGRELSGNPRWAGCYLPGEPYDDGSGICKRFGDMDSCHIDYDFPRHDPVLVQVIDELGGEASGSRACVGIAEVNGPYRIDEYDGRERVMTADDYEWITP